MYQGSILIFGAGASGRGHLGELLHRDGHRDLVFVDKKPDLVELLNTRREYPVRLLTDNETPGKVRVVDGFTALHRTDEDGIVRSFCQSALVLTCVIAENLPDIAEIVAKSIRGKVTLGIQDFTNIICCENLDHASSLLKKLVYEKLTSEEIAYCEQWIGFPDAMISRVVPIPAPGTLEIVTEDYNEWTVDAPAFRGIHPGLPSMDIVKNLDARLERKLWTHNGGHATLAYAGHLKGYPYIHEALSDSALAAFTGKVLDEIGDCIFHKYSGDFTLEQIREYEADLGQRGALREMKDDISRVVRDPLRKLGLHDRLLAPAVYAAENGLPYENLVQSIVNVTRYYAKTDSESQKMQQIIEEKGFRSFVYDILNLHTCPVLAEAIIRCRDEE